jgi:hypothetical protein
MAPAWDFQQLWTDESELADDRLAAQEGWLGVYHDAGVFSERTVKQARDAFLAARALGIGTPHVDYPGAVLKNVRVSRRERVEAFDITLNWENKTGGEDPPDNFNQFMQQSQQDDPENPHGPDYSSYGQFAEEYSHADIAGKLWLNKANQALTNIPPLQITVKVRRVTVNQRDEADIDQMGLASGRKLLYGVNNEQRTHKDKTTGKTRKYFRTTYEVWHHPHRNWADIELLNVGFAILVNGKLEIPRLGKSKDFPQVEVNLSADGKSVLEDGSPPNKIPFKVFREGALNVPFIG